MSSATMMMKLGRLPSAARAQPRSGQQSVAAAAARSRCKKAPRGGRSGGRALRFHGVVFARHGRCKSRSFPRPLLLRLVQITLNGAGVDLRLRRLLCGKAAPFRGASALTNLLRAGWKAQPSSLRGGGGMRWAWPESQRLSAQQAAEPRRPLEELANLDSPCYLLLLTHFFQVVPSLNILIKMPPTTDRAWNPACLPSVVQYQSVSGTRVGVWFSQS